MNNNEKGHKIWSGMTYVQRMLWLQAAGHEGDQATQTRAWTHLSPKIKRALIAHGIKISQARKNPIRRMTHSKACQKLGSNATNAEVYRVCPLCRARLISEGWKPKVLKNPGDDRSFFGGGVTKNWTEVESFKEHGDALRYARTIARTAKINRKDIVVFRSSMLHRSTVYIHNSAVKPRNNPAKNPRGTPKRSLGGDTISLPRRREIKKLLKKVGAKVGQQLPGAAWPGGYPIFYFDADNQVLCPPCARKSLYQDVGYSSRVVEADINYEDPDLHCDDCSKRIMSAYAED